MTPATKNALGELTRELMPRAQLPANKFKLGMTLGLAFGYLHSGNVPKAIKTLNDSADLARKTGVKRKLDEMIAALQGEPTTEMHRP